MYSQHSVLEKDVCDFLFKTCFFLFYMKRLIFAFDTHYLGDRTGYSNIYHTILYRTY